MIKQVKGEWKVTKDKETLGIFSNFEDAKRFWRRFEMGMEEAQKVKKVVKKKSNGKR